MISTIYVDTRTIGHLLHIHGCPDAPANSTGAGDAQVGFFTTQSSVVRDSKHLSQSDLNMTGRAQPPIRGVRPLADIHVRSPLTTRELLRLSNFLRRSLIKNPPVHRLHPWNLRELILQVCQLTDRTLTCYT
jgi:hypothetical protein